MSSPGSNPGPRVVQPVAMRDGERPLRQALTSLQPFLDLPWVTEVAVNRPGEVFVERMGAFTRHEVPELDYARCEAIARLVAFCTGQSISAEQPLCGGALPDGERIQVCIPPVTPEGTISLTIRPPGPVDPDMAWLDAHGLFAPPDTPEGDNAELRQMMDTGALGATDAELARLLRVGQRRAFLELAVVSRRTLLISGSTGSGKTFLARALLKCIPPHERLIVIEDTREMTLDRPNAVPLLYSKDGQGLARLDAEKLLEASLRMRPDRVIIGELRDRTAWTYLRQTVTGHPGGITSLHAGSARGTYDALVLMLRTHPAAQAMADAELRHIIRGSVDVVLHMRRQRGVHAITQILFDPKAA